MLWIIEGPDRTGKSSLAERLSDTYGGDVLHFSAPQNSAIAEYVDPLLGYEPGTGTNLFVDRHYLGERIWPGFFGRPSAMSDADRICIEQFLMSKGALCLLARREPQDLAKACVGEPIEGRTLEVQILFQNAAANSILPWWMYEHGDEIAGLVEQARLQECAAFLANAEQTNTKGALVAEGFVR